MQSEIITYMAILMFLFSFFGVWIGYRIRDLQHDDQMGDVEEQCKLLRTQHAYLQETMNDMENAMDGVQALDMEKVTGCNHG